VDSKELKQQLDTLTQEILNLQTDLKNKPALLRYLPDIQIYEKAVRYALTYNEFYDPRQIGTAKDLIAQGMERAKALRAGSAPWTKQTGLLALGYVSKIDGSVQPYGIVVPPSWVESDKTPHRLDFFCHGRGETLTELAFINDRQRNPGDFTPPDTFVLHPYGRYCNANRFAGEVDLFEALADAKKRYPIDDDRLVIRGFSMGGASCWQYATHHTDVWAAASPGAGFSETFEFLHLPQTGDNAPPWYEQKLMHWYDSIDYAVNLQQLPTIAYNGDRDGQKQAADRMEGAMKTEGLTLTRVIGPNTGHWYQPDSKKEIDAKIAPFVTKGRDTLPTSLRFTTWTLRYNHMDYVTVTGLEKHWERARVNADLTLDAVTVTTQNISRFSLAPTVARKSVVVDGQTLTWPGQRELNLVKGKDGKWNIPRSIPAGLRKIPGLQGPIDDAFLDHFIMVRPTGKPLTEQTGIWVNNELTHATTAWRAQFRGDAIVRDDTTVTVADSKAGNLVLWGDPSSNTVLARIAKRLPVQWDKDGTVHANGKTYPAGTTVPVFIYPNPESPNHYVVINSGITWREEAYLNNDEQRARLPDWAIIDITTPPDAYKPGKIVDAGFFDEEWK
jgi:hypothetical protein